MVEGCIYIGLAELLHIRAIDRIVQFKLINNFEIKINEIKIKDIAYSTAFLLCIYLLYRVYFINNLHSKCS